jgi:DNA-binding FrmR family transcriptional regulator
MTINTVVVKGPKVAERPRRGYAYGKDDYLARLAKVEGQVRGLQRMIGEDKYQIASVTRALQEVAVGLLNDHLSHCVMKAVQSSDAEGDASLDEVASTIRQVMRL